MGDFQDLQNLLSFSLSLGQVVKNLVVALGCGILVSRFYSWVTRHPSNGRSFIIALISLTMITAVVIMVIGNNLARAFGLVGAMSIIRFRTAVKDVRDIVFIFFSLAIGMAAGVGAPAIAFLGTVSIGLVMLVVSRVQTHAQSRRDYLLQFRYAPQAEGEASYLPVFERYCRRHHLINTKIYDSEDRLELSFYVHLKDQGESDDFVLALGQLEGVRQVNLFFDEEYE